MSIFSKIISDVASLLFPPLCPVCRRPLGEGERFVCTSCRYRIPLTNFWREAGNPMEQRFWGIVPVRSAAALFWFSEGSDWRRLVHSFKYSGKWLFARRMGEWFGAELARSGSFSDVDVIVPVPLHWRKRLSRGYNQSEFIAEGMARSMGAVCRNGALRRVRNTPSQTLKHRNDRWENVSGAFSVCRPELLRGRHVLIVDDVFTTGSTVMACAEEIFRTCEGDVTLSVATLALSRNSFDVR